MLFFFFFKQKTAYEIYQCDWSSDVCSSDLEIELPNGGLVRLPVGVGQAVIVDVIQAVTGLQTKRKPVS